MRLPRRGRVKIIAVALLTVVLVLSFAVGAMGAKTTKQLTAIFRNIELVVNGQLLQTKEEPFIINGRTYVPLRVISEALEAWVDWDEANSSITIKTSSTSDEAEALKIQLIQKDLQIEQLQAEIERLKSGSGSSKSDGDLKDLEKELNDDFRRLEDVRIDNISLSGDKDDVDVEIEVDLYRYDDEWEDLKDKEIKSWVEDICKDIQKYFSKDTYVSGEIVDIDSDKTLVTFNKKGTSSLSISYKDSKYRKGGDKTIYEVEDDLKGEKYTVDGIRFEIDYIDYRTSNDVITVRLVATEKGADKIDDDELEDAAEEIGEEIAERFIDDADMDPDTVIIEFYDKDNESLGDFEYDVYRGRII